MKKNKRNLGILIIILISLLALILIYINKKNSDKEEKNANNYPTSYMISNLKSDPVDFNNEEKVIAESNANCGMQDYTNINYPSLKFNYDSCKWTLAIDEAPGENLQTNPLNSFIKLSNGSLFIKINLRIITGIGGGGDPFCDSGKAQFIKKGLSKYYFSSEEIKVVRGLVFNFEPEFNTLNVNSKQLPKEEAEYCFNGGMLGNIFTKSSDNYDQTYFGLALGNIFISDFKNDEIDEILQTLNL